MKSNKNSFGVDTEVSGILCLYQEYTSQIDLYDRHSSSFVMTTIGFFGVIISVLSVIYDSANDDYIFYLISSILILVIPCISTLYLYVFSMNCRKIALYRGYLDVLESRLNELSASNIFCYNNIVDKRILGDFKTNKYGPIIMFSFLSVVYLSSFIISGIIVFKKMTCFKWHYGLIVLWIIVLALSFGSSYIFLQGLVTNHVDREKVIMLVKERGKMCE